MENNKLVNILEEFNLKPEQIDEIMIQFKELIDRKSESSKEPDFNDSIINLKYQWINETDWRKKAALAARIISFNLEN